MVDVQPELGRDLEGCGFMPRSSNSSPTKITAPNGKYPILVGEFWTGYLMNTNSKGKPNPVMALFEVGTEGGKIVRVDFVRSCPDDQVAAVKPTLKNKGEVEFFPARTSEGVICQLFTT